MSPRLGVLLVAGALAVSGCGGGGDDPPTTAGTTAAGEPTTAPAERDEQAVAAVEAYRAELRDYAAELRSHAGKELERRALARVARKPPQLEALETEDPEYAEAEASAADVDAISAELAGMAAATEKGHDDRIHGDIYDEAQRAEPLHRALNDRYFDKLLPVVYSTRSDSPKSRRTVRRLWQRYMDDEIAFWRAHQRRLGRIPARTDLHRSFIAFTQGTGDEAIAFDRRFAEYLRETPIEDVQYGPFTSLAVSFPFNEIPVTVMEDKDRPLVRGFVRSIGRIARGGDANVGDAYRETIARSYLPTSQKAVLRHIRVTEQLWMLWRIRELEDTPADAYDLARQTILLQTIDDPRSPYERMLEVYEESGDDVQAGRREINPGWAAYLEFANAELEGVKPAVLQPMVEAIRQGLDRYPKVERKRIFATAAAQERAERRLAQDLRRKLRPLESAKRMKAETREAVEATRPAD